MIDASIFIASMVATIGPGRDLVALGHGQRDHPGERRGDVHRVARVGPFGDRHVDVNGAVAHLQRPQLAVQRGHDRAQAPLVGLAGGLQAEVELDAGLQLDDVLGAAPQAVQVVGGGQHRQVAVTAAGRW